MTISSPWLLFASAFISSTLMPGGSEAVFAAMVHERVHEPTLLLGIATLGNTLGAMTSWAIGRGVALRYPARAVVPRHQAAVERVRRYGPLVLLLSWLPIIGDPLCVAAGWLRIPWWKALLLIGAGKAARYGAILLLMS